MNRTEYLLTCLAEECSEVAKNAAKAQRFGVNEVMPEQPLTNGERIMEEYCDLLGVLVMLVEDGTLNMPDYLQVHAAIAAKKEKVEKYMRYSESIGTLSK